MKYLLCFLLLTGASLSALEMAPPDSCHAKTYAEIRTACSLGPIHEEIEISNEETLILLDIGGTLLQQRDPILHPGHEPWKRAWLERHYPTLSPQEKMELARIIESFLVTNDCALERLEEWPELVKQAQARKIKVLAFSKILIGPTLPHALGVRLTNFGIPIHDDLPELAGNGDKFIYADGVIHTAEKLKGPVLKEVLSKMKHLPSKIIFVDDREEQVESVRLACQELGIPAFCFHYVGFNEPPFLDETVASYQLENLVTDQHWIPFEEADKILRSQIQY